MSRIIIASAAAFETHATVAALAAQNIECTRIVTGVGMAQSAIVCSRLMHLIKDRDVLFCCTGGLIGSSFEGVKLYSATSVELAPIDVRQNHTALLTEFDPALPLRPMDLKLERCVVCCSLGVTTEGEAGAASLLGTNHDSPLIESIELYAVARSWLPVARSLTAIVAVTNATGAKAREQWRANFPDAAIATARFLSDTMSQNKGQQMGVRCST